MRVRVRERMRAGPVLIAAVLAVIFGGDGAEAQTIQLEGSTPFYTNTNTLTIRVSLSGFTAGTSGTFSYFHNCIGHHPGSNPSASFNLGANGGLTEDFDFTISSDTSLPGIQCEIKFNDGTTLFSTGNFYMFRDTTAPTISILTQILSPTTDNTP